ncbi:hypothetical protein [Exiguobacterium indicum]|uniref:hypothetical protein n=1 Tax=Exiguobacterium indicum TaxID=296995 RepID=UPI000735F084|nr:hypothetical protein [Exiguobacterium indicum]
MGIKKAEEFEVNFVQDLKRLLASYLSTKGQPSVGTETLTALVNKVANIYTGKKFATGTTTTGSEISFAKSASGTQTSSTVTVTGLTFLPSFIIIKGVTNNDTHAIYDARFSSTYAISNTFSKTASTSGGISFRLQSPAVVNATSFVLPFFGNGSVEWIAIE